MGLTRRALLASPLALAGCCREGSPGWDGGWIGLSHERGHRVRDAASALAPGVQRRCDVAIVGGGVAGLAAARALRRAGIEDIRLFELEAEAGGNARGHSMAGMACPMGAHYLPVPGADAPEVAELLHELGLLRHELGRSVPDERHLCHSPQERLWLDGEWIDSLLPPAGPGSPREAQYRRFEQRVSAIASELRFAIPTHRAGWSAGHDALDRQTFAHWLQAEGFTDPGLRWYLDYACRDDYGADAATVSAWAGLHYFASRHGFQAPGDSDTQDRAAEREAVFTWPEGNAWLTRRLASPLGDRLHTGALVRRIDAGRHEIALDVEPSRGGGVERWTARQAVLALPLHVTVRLMPAPPPALRTVAAQVPHAPWLVVNLQLHTALTDKSGAPPSWDNVLYGDSPALGYVDAMHQGWRPMPGPTVLTAYWALGSGDGAARTRQRHALVEQPWQAWAQGVVDDLARAHPDLPGKIARIDLVRHGHAMAVPVPGVRGSPALRALARPDAAARLHFAHADLAGYSIFEEAYTLGDAAGRAAARALRS